MGLKWEWLLAEKMSGMSGKVSGGMSGCYKIGD